MEYCQSAPMGITDHEEPRGLEGHETMRGDVHGDGEVDRQRVGTELRA